MVHSEWVDDGSGGWNGNGFDGGYGQNGWTISQPSPQPTAIRKGVHALFNNFAGMHVVGEEVHGDDDDPVVWVYQINQLKWWAEAVAFIFMMLTLLLMINQIGLHLHYNEHSGFRTYTIRILLMVNGARLHQPLFHE